MEQVFDLLYYLKISLPEIRSLGVSEIAWLYDQLIDRRKKDIELEAKIHGMHVEE